jgi:hypothetical protein
MWWGKRKKRGTQLQRQLALGRLEEAMGQVQQPEQEEGEPPVPYRGAVPLPYRPGLRVADVAVDNSSGPDPAAAGEPSAEPQAPLQQDLPAQRQGDSSRHGSF